tara:strand:+ start:226 stop:864 length:639 start_codon:yes stop_codon:yes gene_type:complete
MDNISVIIRNRNEERYIGYAIQSVIDNFKDPEIIVIDNHSNDDSLKIVRSFPFSNIYIYNMSDYTPGKALNFGVKKSTMDNILVLSAHSEIIKIDYGKVLNQLKKYCTVFGKQTPIWKGKSITPRYIWSNFKDDGVENMYSEMENRYFLHNAFTFYKKDTLVKYPFDERLSGKEDRYWINDRVTEGMKFYYDPINVCKHHYTDNGATWKGIG